MKKTIPSDAMIREDAIAVAFLELLAAAGDAIADFDNLAALMECRELGSACCPPSYFRLKAAISEMETIGRRLRDEEAATERG